MQPTTLILGLLLLLLPFTSGFAQTQIRHNEQAKKDSVLMELPHNTKMILVLDRIENLALVEKTSLDSLVKDLNRQLQAGENLRLAAEPGQLPAQKQAAGGGSLVLSKEKDKELDQLILNVGVGAGLIRHSLVPSLTPGVAIRFQQKREISLGLNMNYFFDRNESGPYSMAVNAFVSAGFGLRIKPSQPDSRWQKLEVGYLVRSRGGYFDKDTFKLSYTYPIASQKVHLIPELYFSNSFRTVFPGISIRFY
jgi:hypothetical protein